MMSLQRPVVPRVRWRRLPLLLAVGSLPAIVLSVVACGSERGGLDYPTGRTDLVVQVSVGGGFVPVEYNLTQIPGFTLYGDGTVVVTGPQIEIYPQPALPNLQTTTISAEATREILSAAKEAGLFANDVDYGQPGITDVGTTTITINADGNTYVSDIYALGMEPGAPGLTTEQQQARAGVNEFIGQAADLTAFQTGEIKWQPYAFAAVAVYSEPYDPTTAPDGTDVQPNHLDWPLSDLGIAGTPVQPEGFRKVVVSGEDLTTLRPLLEQATQITLWKSGDREYHLYFRPLLPDETA
jgi:hypothetical protein